MPVLWQGDRAICVFAFLIDDRKKTYNFYIGGRDESVKGPPVGLVLHAYAIRHAIANGITSTISCAATSPTSTPSVARSGASNRSS